MTLTELLHVVDRRQQASRRIGFLAGVVRKFGEDQGGQLAALISYYAFVSLFPLLLVFVTILGFILEDDPDAQQRILDGLLGQIPLIGDQLELHSLSGSGVALLIGIVGALLAGMGITNTAQSAFARIWDVPFKRRRGFIQQRLYGLGVLAILGTLCIASSVAAGLVGAASLPALEVAAALAVALAFNFALFMAAFKLLTAAEVGWRDFAPGVITAAVGLELLQQFGGYYVTHVLERTEPLYGMFALVLGLLAWLYLVAQLTVFAAEINVVRLHHLWPRSFFPDTLLDADRRALTSSARTEERVESEDIAVHFDERE